MLGFYLFFKCCAWIIKIVIYAVAGMVLIAAAVFTFVALLLITIANHFLEKNNVKSTNSVGSPDGPSDRGSSGAVRGSDRVKND